MRRPLPCTVAVACLLSTPIIAARTEPLSWGKAGVSIDQYRTDAISCGRLGYYADVSHTEAAHVFKNATGQLQANEADLTSATGPRILDIVTQSARIVDGTRPTERMRDVGTLLQSKVDACLQARGYTRFRLTGDQRKHLSRLHLGSPARHRYLYQLATDPQVLSAQAM